jgi:hypothetical protein
MDNRNPNAKYPDWATPRGAERSLSKFCYTPTKDVEATFRKEANALIAATQLAMSDKQTLARDAAIDFLSLRDKRRALLSGTSLNGTGKSDLDFCQQSESVMELLEGSANWVGDGGQLAGGRLSVA